MAKEKSYLPQSTAGLIRYYDVEESGIRLKPEHVILITVTFTAIILVMKFMG